MFAAATLFFGGLAGNCGTPARAQVQRSEPSPAAPPTTLTGDWGALRSYLDRNGISFTLNYTNDFLANVRGGIGRGADGLGIFSRNSTST
jgi:carbohydrate-selective porin OprB